MSSVYDGNLTVSIFGQSHAPAIGVTIDGLPAGLPVDLDALGRFLRRRAPGQNAWSTPRKEADLPEFLCGLKDGRTCGAPLTAIIRNTNTRSGDYENLMDIPRPGHADYTAQVKFGGAQDAAGGGHFSGRLTAPLCIAGGLCLQILARQGVRVRARIVSIGTVTDDAAFDAPVDEKPFPAVSDEAAAAMQAQIAQVKAEQDSGGGVIECVIEGLPAGIGDPMFGGLENRSKVIKVSEKKAIAYHEAGHATVSWLLEHAHPLLKVTIVPRGKALGAAWYLPQERQITTKEQLLDQMCSVLGGRAAEELTFGQISTGAQNDLERATKQAYAMVTIFGMSEKIGNLSYYDSSGQSDFSFTKPYSEKTAELIDSEVKELVENAYNRAKELLKTHQDQHRQVAELLLEREVIFSDDLERILGKRPWKDDEEEETKEEKTVENEIKSL